MAGPPTVAKAFSRGGSPLRSTLPELGEEEKRWKSLVFVLIALLLTLGTGIFAASFFADESASLGPRTSLFIGGVVVAILWLAFTALSFLLLRGRLVKFILLVVIPMLLWLPLYLVGEYRPGLILVAMLISALGIGFGWARMSFRARANLSVRPFSESAQMIRWVLISLALSISLLFLPTLSGAAADNPQEPPRIFSLVTSSIAAGFRTVGLTISPTTPLDKVLENFLATFDRTFQAAPATLRQALIRAQREFVAKVLFPSGTTLSGRETVEELLWKALALSGSFAWAVPVIIFFILLAPAVLVRWVSSAASWVILELMLALGFVHIGKELVEKEVVVLA